MGYFNTLIINRHLMGFCLIVMISMCSSGILVGPCPCVCVFVCPLPFAYGQERLEIGSRNLICGISIRNK